MTLTRDDVIQIMQSDKDLSKADLRRVNLRGLDLRGADLRGADLRGANLSDADLSDADLRGADLRGASTIGTRIAMLYIPSMSSRHDALYVCDCGDDGIRVWAGCYQYKTVDEARARFREVKGNDSLYEKALDLALLSLQTIAEKE
jgi:uncharacterized protein YjbI with pentapeptide repeats